MISATQCQEDARHEIEWVPSESLSGKENHLHPERSLRALTWREVEQCPEFVFEIVLIGKLSIGIAPVYSSAHDLARLYRKRDKTGEIIAKSNSVKTRKKPLDIILIVF
jgi:hypothetical protein